MKTFVVTSLFQGRLEIPGQKEPLFLGGSHTYFDKLPERILYFLGESKVSVTSSEVALGENAKAAENTDTVTNSKKSSKNKES